KLQPLDVGFFGPLKTAFSQEADKWMTSNPGKVITQSHIALLFGRAYSRVASLAKAEKSFFTTGIWPFNRDVFSEEYFAPSTVTDQPQTTTPDVQIEVEPEILQHLQQHSSSEPRLLAIAPIDQQYTSEQSEPKTPINSPDVNQLVDMQSP